MAIVLATSSAIVQAVSVAPYIRDILRGKTRPYRMTWTIWLALALVVFAAQLAEGAGLTLMLIGAQVVGMTVVVFLGVRRGVGGGSVADLVMAAIAAAGIAGWYLAGTPMLATLGVLVADAMAVLLMLPKVWRDPESETLFTFILGWTAGALAVAAVLVASSLTLDERLAMAVYPAYLMLAASVISVTILIRTRAPRQART